MTTDLIYNVAILFIMMVPGFIMKKCRLAGEGFGKGLSNLVLYIAQPALIVSAYVLCESKLSEIWRGVVAVLVLSLIAHLIFTVFAMLLFRGAEDKKRRMLRFATVFSNAAFMGIPLIESLLGAEAAIYASIYNITFNAFLWTLGVHLCTSVDNEDIDRDGDIDLRDSIASSAHHIKKASPIIKLLIHPVTIASVIGFALLALGINAKAIEGLGLSIITDCLVMLKSLVAPLSMVVIGLRLGEISLKGMFKDGYMYLFLALRHAVLPLLVLGIIKLAISCGIPIGNEAAEVVIIMAATPAATSATMFAEMYDCDACYVSRLVVLSTSLCIITMPLILMLL